MFTNNVEKVPEFEFKTVETVIHKSQIYTRPLPPPKKKKKIKDGKMESLGFRAASFLISGEWGFAVPFYSVQEWRKSWIFLFHSEIMKLGCFLISFGFC